MPVHPQIDQRLTVAEPPTFLYSLALLIFLIEYFEYLILNIWILCITLILILCP
jgi:hypothetical protein